MTKLRCEDVDELSAEYALGVLEGEERAAMIAHLETCGRCRASVNDLAEIADLTLLLGPGAEPPADFEQRVLAAIEPRPVARSRWPRYTLYAVAACIALLLLVAVPVGLAGRRSADVSVAMRNASGTEVGTATIKDGSPPSVSMALNTGGYPAPTASYSSYSCEVVLEDGQVVNLGSYHLGEGKTDWWGVLPAPSDQVDAVRLLDGEGKVVATADLD